MSYHGAINKETNEYEYPRVANKSNKYECVCCHANVLFKKGDINIPYFSHLSGSDCSYYGDKPNESDTHRDAKLLLKSLFENKKQITMYHKCCDCKIRTEFVIPVYDDTTTTIQLEHQFQFNGLKVADIAYICHGEINYIFEIYHSHKTKIIDRPEIWFEIHAKDFIKYMNTTTDTDISIQCIRQKRCDNCQEDEKHRIELRLIMKEREERERLEEERIECLRKENMEQLKKERIERVEKERINKVEKEQQEKRLYNQYVETMKKAEDNLFENQRLAKERIAAENKKRQEEKRKERESRRENPSEYMLKKFEEHNLHIKNIYEKRGIIKESISFCEWFDNTEYYGSVL
jgi:hypothetical protein